MHPKYGNCMRLLKIKNKMKIGWFTNKVGKNSRYFVGVFNRIVISLALVGYEMIIANSALRTSLATYHLISNAQRGQKWNNASTRPCVKYRQVTIVIHNKNSFNTRVPPNFISELNSKFLIIRSNIKGHYGKYCC